MRSCGSEALTLQGCVQLAAVLKPKDVAVGPPHLLTAPETSAAAAHQQIQPAVFHAAPPHSTLASCHICSVSLPLSSLAVTA